MNIQWPLLCASTPRDPPRHHRTSWLPPLPQRSFASTASGYPSCVCCLHPWLAAPCCTRQPPLSRIRRRLLVSPWRHVGQCVFTDQSPFGPWISSVTIASDWIDLDTGNKAWTGIGWKRVGVDISWTPVFWIWTLIQFQLWTIYTSRVYLTAYQMIIWWCMCLDLLSIQSNWMK
jgi:hypothetical protein